MMPDPAATPHSNINPPVEVVVVFVSVETVEAVI